MNLVKIYEDYNTINNAYIKFIDELSNNECLSTADENIVDKLKEAQDNFEALMIKAENEKVDKENLNNLQDLKYLIMDGIFVASDLLAFYKYNHVERFKMRAINYINKKRKADMFKDSYSGSCRV